VKKVRFLYLLGYLNFRKLLPSIFAFLTFWEDVAITINTINIYIWQLAENFLYTYALAISTEEVYEGRIDIQNIFGLANFKKMKICVKKLNDNLQKWVWSLKEVKYHFLKQMRKKQRVSQTEVLTMRNKITLLHFSPLEVDESHISSLMPLNSIKFFLIEKW